MAQHLDGIDDALLHTNYDRSSSSARSAAGERAKEWMVQVGELLNTQNNPR
jgi:hypothetical protein